MQTTLEAALQYAANGFRVLPLKPGTKQPDLRNWPEEATTDPERLRVMWDTSTRHGKGAEPNLGIACGGSLAVLDLDSPTADPPAWVPETLTARTPSGGRHYYLAVDKPVPNSVKRVRHDIDIRGERGQVAAPPSIIQLAPAGRIGRDLEHPVPAQIVAYEWLNTAPIARIDADLLIPEDLKLNAAGRRASFEWRDDVPVGERNNYLTSLAGYLFAQGLEHGSVFADVGEEADRLGFTPHRGEISSIVRSVARYHR